MTRSIYVKIFVGFIVFLLFILGLLAYVIVADETGSISNQSDFPPIYIILMLFTFILAIFVAIYRFYRRNV